MEGGIPDPRSPDKLVCVSDVSQTERELKAEYLSRTVPHLLSRDKL